MITNLAETVNSLYKTEMVYRDRSFEGVDDLEWATLLYVDWLTDVDFVKSKISTISIFLPCGNIDKDLLGLSDLHQLPI